MVSMKDRLLLDGGIFLGTLACMAYAWTGKLLHEWIGLAVVVLFVIQSSLVWQGLYRQRGADERRTQNL